MKAKKKTLKNGLNIITVPLKEANTVSVYVFVSAGTKYETKDQNGISHFLEHMCFKGTTKRPKSKDINLELDSIGAVSNAFTSHEFTAYFAKGSYKNFSKILSVLSDVYMNSVFPEKELEKERGVILEEINMYEDLPQRKVGSLFYKLMFGDQPVGWTVLGPKEVIKSLKREDFLNYRNKHYVARATTVVVSGRFDEKNILSQIEDSFSDISRGDKGEKVSVVEKQTGPRILIENKKIDQTHLILGVRTFPGNDKRSATLAVLSSILGGGMSSRLFEKMREELGICYYVRASVDDFTDHGFLGIASGVDTKRVKLAVSSLVGELRKMTKDLVSQDELNKAKEYAIGEMYMGLDTSDSIAEYYAMEHIVRDSLESPMDLEKKLRAVTAKEVRDLAKQIFRTDRLNLAIIGKVPEEKELKSVLKI